MLKCLLHCVRVNVQPIRHFHFFNCFLSGHLHWNRISVNLCNNLWVKQARGWNSIGTNHDIDCPGFLIYCLSWLTNRWKMRDFWLGILVNSNKRPKKLILRSIYGYVFTCAALEISWYTWGFWFKRVHAYRILSMNLRKQKLRECFWITLILVYELINIGCNLLF